MANNHIVMARFGPYLDLETPRLESFRVFISGLRRLIADWENNNEYGG
jgi:hypothetical protein